MTLEEVKTQTDNIKNKFKLYNLIFKGKVL